MNLIVLQCNDNEPSHYLRPPKGMPILEACDLVDATVAKIKLDPEYDYIDLDEALTALGFTWPRVATCMEKW